MRSDNELPLSSRLISGRWAHVAFPRGELDPVGLTQPVQLVLAADLDLRTPDSPIAADVAPPTAVPLPANEHRPDFRPESAHPSTVRMHLPQSTVALA